VKKLNAMTAKIALGHQQADADTTYAPAQRNGVTRTSPIRQGEIYSKS
jgi:hypothetical protein